MLLRAIQVTIAWIAGAHCTRHRQLDGQNIRQLKPPHLRCQQTITMRYRVALQRLAVGRPFICSRITEKQIDREAQGARILAANDAGQLGDGQSRGGHDNGR